MALGGLNIGDLLLTILADGSQLQKDIERQAIPAANAAGSKMGSTLGASMSKGLMSKGRAMESLGAQWSLAITTPIVGAGAAITKVSLDFDTKLRQIVALTDVTAGEIGNVREEILKLAPAVGKSPQELADAFYFLASGGFDAKESLEILNTSAHAAAAGLGETSAITKVIGASINAFGKQNLTAKDATDQLIRAIKDGTAEAPNFAGALGDVVGSAAILGSNFSDTAGALAAMTIKGITADEAATSLNQVFRSLIKTTPQSEKAFASVGLSAEELKDQLKKEGLLSLLKTLEERFRGNDVAAGEAFGNVRALRGVLALIGDGGGATAKILEDVANGTTNLNTAFADTEGPGRRVDQALTRINVLMIQLGEDVLPVVVDILEDASGFLTTIGDIFKSLPQPVRDLTVKFLALAAAMGPILFIGGKMTKALGGLIGVVGKIATKVGEKFIGNMAAEMGSEVVARRIGAPLAEGIDAGTRTILGSTKLGAGMDKLGTFLGSTLGKAVSVAFAAVMIYEVYQTYDRIKGELAGQNDQISKDVANQIQTGTEAQLQQSKAALEKGLTDINGVWDAGIFTTDTRKRLEADLAAVNTELERRAKGFGPAIADGIDKGAPAVEHSVNNLLDPAKTGKMTALARAAGRSIPESIADGIIDKQNEVTNALSSLVKLMKVALTPAQDIARTIGVLTSEELAKGLHDKRKVVRDEAERVRALGEKHLAELILAGGKVGQKAAANLAKKLRSRNQAVRNAAKRVKAIVDSELAKIPPKAGDVGSQAGNSFASNLKKAVAQQFAVPVQFNARIGGKNRNMDRSAIGGVVRAGIPTLVNEETPRSEIFVPSVGGHILNRAQAQAALGMYVGGNEGGDTINVNVPITGILRAESPAEVAARLRQMAVGGVLKNPRRERQVEVPTRV